LRHAHAVGEAATKKLRTAGADQEGGVDAVHQRADADHLTGLQGCSTTGKAEARCLQVLADGRLGELQLAGEVCDGDIAAVHVALQKRLDTGHIEGGLTARAAKTITHGIYLFSFWKFWVGFGFWDRVAPSMVRR